MDFLLAMSVFGLVYAAIHVCLGRMNSRWSINTATTKRLANAKSVDADEQISITRKQRDRDGDLVRGLLGLGLINRLDRLLLQAGMRIRISEMLLIEMLGFLAGAAIGQHFFRDALFSFAMGAGATAIPLVYVVMGKRRRLKALNQQLPHVLDLIKSSLEAGHSLQRALQVVVGEFADPIGSEFRIVLEQNRMGLPMARAIEEMTERVPDEDLRLLCIAVKVQSDVGSSLAQIVGRLSEIVRVRQRLQLQVRALTAQSRLSGIVVGLLPVVVLILFSIIKPGYLADLVGDPAGIKILKTAMALDAVAIVFIRSLLKVEY